MKDFTRVFDILSYQENKYPQTRALNQFENGKWVSFSTQKITHHAETFACWLIENGYQKGDRIAVIPKTGSANWMIVEFALQQCGLISVPMHPTASLEEIAFILHETEASLCIAADFALYNKISTIVQKSAHCKNLFHLEQNKEGYFSAFSKSSNSDKTLLVLNERKQQVTPQDILVILYTSGTSGTPKGVVLSHGNVVSCVKSILLIFPLLPSQKVLSFLPYSHVFERTASLAYMAFGVELYFNSSLDALSRDFKTIRPYFCTCVPKTLEKMTEILDQKLLEKNWIAKKVIHWAMQVGERFKEKKKQGIFYPIQLLIARLLVLRTFRNALGGKIKYMIVGAAALRPQISRLFSAAGIHTLSGYGMTETSPFITVNRPLPGLNCFGTVGIPAPGVDVVIDNPNENDEGEILVKGPNVMQGYYKRTEQTREVLSEDGWLRTGDVGRFEQKRFLVITDRKKDIFKTSTGKYIAPQPIENHFTTSPFITQCLILGFNQRFVSAILVPNFMLLQAWCEENGIHWTSAIYMVHNIKVIKKFQEEVDTLNEKLQSHERVKKFILSEEEWTVENKDLTTSFKPKRNRLLEKHVRDIEKIYME
jgi:long-chain acyl-CoA synthetase